MKLSTAIREFLAWIAKKNINTLPPNKIELLRIDEPGVVVLDHETVEKLSNAPNTESLKGKRDKAILETLFSTGLRVAELDSLNRKDVKGKQEISVVGKGSKRRVVFLSPTAQNAIDNYLSMRKDSDSALFVRNRVSKQQESGRLSVRSIQRIIQSYAAQAGIADEVTPHTLRHTFATR